MTDFDSREFRNALGAFATGVTIVTTMADADESAGDGMPIAMTANSFSSVSLDPPLILWSVARSAQSFDDFNQATHFAVHILHGGQQELSNNCATKNIDKFADIDWHTGALGSPIFDDYNTCFECTVEHKVDGGDHVIIIGRVHRFDNNPKDTHANPLVFYQGKYKSIA